MKKFKLIAAALLLSVFLVKPVMAQTEKPPLIRLPMIVTGESKTVDEPVDRDLVLAGADLKLVTTVAGDAYVAGGQIEVSGEVGGDLIVAGGNVTISGKIAKNLIAAGGQIKVTPEAEIGGYVMAGGGNIDLNGKFMGPVKVGAGKLALREKAILSGDLEADVGESEIAETAVISGEKRIKIYEERRPEVPREVFRGMVAAGSMVYFLGTLVTLLVLVALAGKLTGVARGHIMNFWPTLGWGLVVMAVTPLVVMILMMTVVGIPLALIIMGLYIMALYISGLITAAAAGAVMAKKGWLKTDNNYLTAAVGLVVVGIAGWIPFVGWLFKFISLLLGLGIMFKLATVRSRPALVKKKI